MKLLYLTLSALIVFTHGMLVRLPNADFLKSVYKWNILEFSFPSDRAKQQAEVSGNLKPENAIPIDVQPIYNKKRLRTFVTIPRFQDGIPYSLATVSEKGDTKVPLLESYPYYEAHNDGTGVNCDAITSAFRMVITKCNQMWVIDSGSVGLDTKCPPQLLLFDLDTDKLIHRYRFNTSLYTPQHSLFITHIVDVRDPFATGSCKNTMVYAADVTGPGLVVYDFMHNNAWRIENRFMYPDPDHGLLSVAGESFILMDGIFGMATDKRNLYFHPLASTTEYAVPLSVIDNSSIFENNVNGMRDKFTLLGSRRSPCTASAMDSRDNLYCVSLNPIKLLAWNVNTPYDSEYIIELPVRSEYLEFVSGLKVVKNYYNQEELWLFSNKFQKTAAGTRQFNETNFNILVMPFENVQLPTQKKIYQTGVSYQKFYETPVIEKNKKNQRLRKQSY